MDNLPIPIVAYSPVQNRYICELETAIRSLLDEFGENGFVTAPAAALLEENAEYHRDFAVWAGMRADKWTEAKVE